MTSVRVPRFIPSVNGFAYANAWPSTPIRQFKLANVATLDIGDAANGLCGGMSFTVADLHRAGLPMPADASPPKPDTARYRYIVDRQITSFDSGKLPLRFYRLMSPTRPATEPSWAAWLGRTGVDRHSRTYVMVHEEWPIIRRLLDSGTLAMLGLVRVVSADPMLLSRNHQVLAYGYDIDGTRVTIRICDPNWPRDDTVTITLDIADPFGSSAPTWSKPDAPLVCFFTAPFTPIDPASFR
jgi:hypothetical protein